MAAADLLNSWQPYNVRRDTTPHPKIFSHDGTPQFGFMELFAERDLKEGARARRPRASPPPPPRRLPGSRAPATSGTPRLAGAGAQLTEPSPRGTAGEELVHTYGHTHRNDGEPGPAPPEPRPSPARAPARLAPLVRPSAHPLPGPPGPAVSLLVYGFVQRLDPPLLCSIDLPSFKEDNPWDNTPEEDDTYYDVSSRGRRHCPLFWCCCDLGGGYRRVCGGGHTPVTPPPRVSGGAGALGRRERGGAEAPAVAPQEPPDDPGGGRGGDREAEEGGPARLEEGGGAAVPRGAEAVSRVQDREDQGEARRGQGALRRKGAARRRRRDADYCWCWCWLRS